ncbi:MAG: EAL domain-containing protein [Granulosicoccus sp.]
MATVLVLSMQAGFLMLEGGRVRAKNSINVAQKNVTDMMIVWAVFFSGGSLLMFGASISSLVGDAALEATVTHSELTPLHFIFQVAFCSTAATIVSGAVAERITFRAYLAITVVVAGLIYPIAGRLVWGNIYNPEVSAWLADLGFIDFAGATVVHGVGAWVGLVAILMIGPRIGRFDEDGKPRVMPAHNAVIALFGVFILLIGWLGFNGGSVSPEDPRLSRILFNTITAGVFGGCAGMLMGVLMDKGVFNPARVISGLLGGLVACTASIHFLSMHEAMVIGATGGGIATYAAQALLYRYKLDDPLDVVATHGIAGALGTLSVAFVMPVSAMQSQSRLVQFGVQLTGIVVIAVFTCLVTWITIALLKRFMEVRVSAEAEQLGLNYTEHGESIGINRLQKALTDKLSNHSSFASGININDDEHSELASTLNQVIDKYESASEQIRAAQHRFRQFAETASDWLWESDLNLQLSFVHANTDTLYEGFCPDKIRGANLLDVLEFSEQELEQLRCCLGQGQRTPVFEATLRISQHPGDAVAVEVRAIPSHDNHGNATGYRGTITDISVRKAAEGKALYLSMHDELTGLPNRRALSRDLGKAIDKAEASRHSVVVAGIDLDGFKAVNDAYGHGVGDELLIQVSDRLHHILRPLDIAYRTGGDEFVIVFDELESRAATKISESVSTRLVAQLSEPFQVQNLTLRVGASVGLSRYPQDDHAAENLLRMADLALYVAKDSGKGCVVSFKPLHDKDADEQRQTEQDLLQAIKNKEFYLMYQPQIDTSTEAVIGYEALIRWAHPLRGEISPADFIPIAEKLYLMDRIGEYVLDNACAFASTWTCADGGKLPSVSVNVSPQQFKDRNFFTKVVDILTRYQLEPDRLELEITEDVLVDDFTSVSSILRELRDYGVAIAVDDFGTGQTSLRYLNQFPLSTIKIDRSFIRNLGTSDMAAEITRTIVMLGQKLGINVIAEGVEESDQLNLLKQWKCDQIQGFLFSKPVSSDAVTRWMDERNVRLRDGSVQ